MKNITLNEFIKKEKVRDPKFKKHFEKGYEEFKLEIIGDLIKEARKDKKLTQEELAKKLHTKKSSISRMEKHASDVKLSTLEKVSHALGKKLEVRFV
ncbi:helix-turn-helix transcriptional regulator [bacterium]|jgi:HTH-type transcriptional regulator / antitoxin HipB|nr:helix-turn-helix transcriptional regulator [bacterium]MBT4551414.1 helix-turn-helix transcriptional regulator [bacterium]MBT7088777.1 helix-turn-helix transcriptional regulator [bacterium]